MARREPRIDRYLAALDDEQAAALERLRRAIQAAAPQAEECISYQLPAFRLEGRFLVAFGAATKHCALYPGAAAIATHAPALAKFSTSKGAIRFQPGAPLSLGLIRKLVRTRMASAARGRAGGRTRKLRASR